MVWVVVWVGSWIVVTPRSPWTTVEVEMMDVVDVYCDVNGKMTVNSPDGEPDAIFLVAVRTNVEVLVTIVVQSGAGDASVVAGRRPTELVEDDTRHLQAEVTNSESYGSSPIVRCVSTRYTLWPPAAVSCWTCCGSFLTFIVTSGDPSGCWKRSGKGRGGCENGRDREEKGRFRN